MTTVSTTIHVAGTGLRGSGYPNAVGTLRILRGLPGVEVRDRARWLPEGTALWRKAGRGGTSLVFLARLAWLNALEALRVLPLARVPTARVYAPYPSIFLLWWLSLLPRVLRPRVVADAYVSLWDAAFRDRGLASERGLVSRCFRRFEARALRAADRVHVDTVANREWFISSFGVDPSRIRAIPLVVDIPQAGGGTPSDKVGPETSALKVLFIGTLVPLHGIGVIAAAAGALLNNGANVEFTFVGDGQDRAALEALVESHNGGRVTWIRDWQSTGELMSRIREADVCLGVFGGGGKASRVLPFKIYLALAAGKAVVTQERLSLPQGVPAPPVFFVPPDANSLALAIGSLAGDRARLVSIATKAGDYYASYLSPKCIAREWRVFLEDGSVPSGGD